MSYENGFPLNHYAAMRQHKKNLKRRHTPVKYFSYEIYLADRYQRDEDLADWLRTKYPDGKVLSRMEKRKVNGEKEYYEKYWKGYSGYFSPGWKKNLKEEAHSKERAYYKREIDEALRHDYDDEEDNFDLTTQKRFGERWNWE